MHSLLSSCFVCGEKSASLSPANLKTLVCADLDCRRVAEKQTTMPPFHYKHYREAEAKRICLRRKTHQEQQTARAKELTNRKKIKHDAEMADKDFWLSQLTSHNDIIRASELTNLTIPSGPLSTKRADSARHHALLEHLQSITTKENAEPSQNNIDNIGEETQEITNPIVNRLCATCAGGCCTKGGNTAYLSVQTIERVRSTAPNISNKDVIQLYTDLLPHESMDDSCIYHTRQGCALPRDLRSDTCNQYRCDALRELTNSSNNPTDTPAVLVFQRQQDNWQQHLVDIHNPIVDAFLLTEDQTLNLAPVIKI